MSNLIYWVHASVDGFIDGPNGEFDWPVMGPELSAYSEALDERVGTLLYGRPVWDMMVGFWPRAEEFDQGSHTKAFAPFWRATPKVVCSRTFAGDEWTDRVIGDDLPGAIRALKAEAGADVLLTGGSGLAAALTEHGLIDEYHVAVHPVVLGGGRPLFREPGRRLNLHMERSRVVDGRIVITHYRPS
ncbi:dihydrofolate reductase family protein [Dactylosporangium sp. CS-033363]|uniref:dihydrofolate reductase family protein n=1 Tax=Dactylosporangium sp. CS-033363 TaxID=3239935 RepID=UPI003D8D4701